MSSHLFQALCVLWAASELWLGWRRHSGDAARLRDGGTLRLLLIAIYGSVALAVWFGTTGLAPFPESARAPALWLGMAMMVCGIAVRWWAIRVLAQWFTVDVAIREGHRLVRSGPYRHVRHPSYTGALLTFYGFALAFGNWLSLAVVVVFVTAAFLWRIRIEERVLSQAFPQDYPAYVRETKRLVPGVW